MKAVHLPSVRPERPVLSICIPTWNRADLLAGKLTVFAPFLSDAIELVVVDNGSTDRTGEVLAEFGRQHPGLNLSFWSNETNLGADVNYLRVLELASGTWLWLIGDDEPVDPARIGDLMDALRGRDGLVLLSAPPWRVDGTALPCKVDLATFLLPEYDYWGMAIHQIGLFVLERERARHFFRVGYARGIGHLHAYSFLSYGILEASDVLHVIEVPGLIRDGDDPGGDAPRWNQLAGHVAAWRSSELALGDRLAEMRGRERRMRSRAVVLNAVIQMAAGKRLPADVLAWMRTVMPIHLLPVVLLLSAMDRLPQRLSTETARNIMRLLRRPLPEHRGDTGPQGY